MSDCSTEAFKPKKRNIGIVLRLEINDPNDNMSNTTEVEINEHRFVSEQRYQQLEQVAKELYNELEDVTDRRLDRRVRQDLLETYFYKLNDCGVSLDD